MNSCNHPCCPDTGPCRKVKAKRPRKPIPVFSTRRTRENKLYSVARIAFLKKHPVCAAMLPGCSSYATDVHHMAGRIGANLMDEITWLPVCRNCHRWIEERPAEAKEKGLSISRLNK